MTTASFTPESWATDLLTRMGYPVTSNNLTSVLAWENQEGGHFHNAATFNPLNSTLGHATYGQMNTAHVATYPDYETGMNETVKTLNEHYYDKIRADLQASADPSTTTATIKASPWGTWHGAKSPAADIRHAQATVAAHPPAAAAHPTAPAPTVTAPKAASLTAATSGGSFVGADVDGLDRLAQGFTQAAQVCDEVRMVCEAIDAAASMFGPFGAAFVAYLKGTVIPWLQRISQALQAMSKVLSAHSQAQKDASSTSTSLPSYQTPANLPQTSTTNSPSIIEQVVSTALGVALGPIGSTTAAVALIGAVAGATATSGPTGTSAAPTAVTQAGEAPERIAPHTAEISRNVGTIANREAVQNVEEEALGVEPGSKVHPTLTIAQTDGSAAVYASTGEHVDTSILQVKGGAAAFGGYDAKDGFQLGAGANASANLVDVKVHTDASLGALGTLKASDETTVGATAQVQAIGAYNPATQTLTATAGGEAFLGARSVVTIAEVNPYFTNTTELTGQLGAGAAADAGIVLSPGHVSIHGGIGAAVGLGGKVSDNLDVDYQRIATDTYTGATTLVTDAERTIGSYFTPTPPNR